MESSVSELECGGGSAGIRAETRLSQKKVAIENEGKVPHSERVLCHLCTPLLVKSLCISDKQEKYVHTVLKPSGRSLTVSRSVHCRSTISPLSLSTACDGHTDPGQM